MTPRPTATEAVQQEILVAPDTLRDWVAEVIARQGVSTGDARTVADALVAANQRGVDSHGVIRLPIYVERLRRGVINPRAQVRPVVDRPALAVLDGDNGLGMVVASIAMTRCMEMARAHGGAFVLVRNSNHFGTAGHYALHAARAGMVAFALTNAEAVVAPFGGLAARFGTNPLAIGIPGGPDGAVVLDMATSAGAWGRIAVAAQRGERIPPDWALGPDGEPTTDAATALAGLLLPFGGHKGSSLGFMIDLLCGVLTGGLTGTEMANIYTDLDRPQGTGHFFACLDAASVGDLDGLRARVGGKAEELVATPARPGARVAWPGQVEAEVSARRMREGIPLPPTLVDELWTLGEREETPFPVQGLTQPAHTPGYITP